MIYLVIYIPYILYISYILYIMDLWIIMVRDLECVGCTTCNCSKNYTAKAPNLRKVCKLCLRNCLGDSHLQNHCVTTKDVKNHGKNQHLQAGEKMCVLTSASGQKAHGTNLEIYDKC